MVPDNLRFGGGVSETVLNPAVAVILLLAGVLMCILPQKKAIVPFLLTSILIPGDQIIVVAGLHFTVLRVLIFFGMIRILLIKSRGEKVFSGGLNKVDKSVILLALTTTVAEILLFKNTQIVIFQLGALYTAFGTYFFLRCVIRDREDVIRVIRVLALIVVVAGSVMVYEQFKGFNPYALLGGARANDYARDMVRDGYVRAKGPFAQPIPAGTFAAVLLPLFIGIWLTDKKQRLRALLGIVGATAMVLASHSSTPLLGLVAGVVGLCLWPIRGITHLIRGGIVLALIALHLVMKAPVWALITRFDITGSSYHRYYLIDNCIRRFSEWWLIGTNSNAAWGWDMWDIANQYVAHAVTGGLAGLIFFIAIIYYAFKYLGMARRAAVQEEHALFFWALSAALLAHVVSFFGISYFDQSEVEWYTLLAVIAAVAIPHARVAEPQIEVALNRAIGTDIRPAYLGWSDSQLFARKSMSDSAESAVVRRPGKES